MDVYVIRHMYLHYYIYTGLDMHIYWGFNEPFELCNIQSSKFIKIPVSFYILQKFHVC